ncbi:MAG: amino acid adenylation domain-containing protein, partial [Deltaproteobacteria bacterium]
MVTVNKKIVHTVFEEIAERFPGRIAIRHAGREISYCDLNRLSDDIAKLLKHVGVKRDVIVGVLLESSIAYVAAIIGVMKTGGVFLPLDMSFPEKRLEYILRKTVPEVIISEMAFEAICERLEATGLTKDILGNHECPVILVDQTTAFFSKTQSEINPFRYSWNSSDVLFKNRIALSEADGAESFPDPDDSCYIIYTSGSTGVPKAIEGCYKSLSHFVHWEVKEFGFDERIRVTQLPPVTFDASLRDIFVPLITGGMLCIPEKDTRTNMKALVQWMEEAGITLVHCVPSLFRMITKEIDEGKSGKDVLPELRYILMAGEPLYGKDVSAWMDIVGERVTLVNLYGPSETTLVKTFYPIRQRPASPNAMIPVGHPISNTAILITKGNRLCEPGEIGDIFIKTPFRTKGYYHDPDLTKMSFVPNPLTSDPEDIVYKTGDIGRYLPDRGIEFIGRLDTQVKVNGIRIELGEIETTLLGSDFIDQAVVVGHRSLENENTIVCYYTEKRATNAGEVSDWLRLTLPAYMTPSFYVRLDEFPLNINGKIDRKALPKPEELIYEGIAYQAPADEKEETLARIWADVLHLEKVGVNSPFFRIGGHSLTATRVLSRIYREMGVEISLRDFFANQTIRGLAALLQDHSGSEFAHISPLELQPDYAVSASQRRLWVLDRIEDGSVAYSLPGLFMVNGDFDIPLFRRAFLSLIARHESLRTTFFETDTGPRQIVHEMPDTYEIGEIDLSLEPDPEGYALQYAMNQATIFFDLSMGPLLRVTIITLSCGRHAIFLNMHHIIGDAWSFDILARDLLSIYGAYLEGRENPLSPLRVQYRDYAAWQNARLEADEARKMSLYWREKLSGAELSALDLPLDFPRPLLQTYMGKSFFFSLDKRLATGLDALARKHDASMFMILLTLVKILLHRYTGQKDIIVGSPVACRNHPDLEDQIGFYANTLALRDRIDGDESFVQVLEKVQKTTIDAYDHQQYPFDRLVDELNLARDPGHAPLFDVMLVYQDEEPEDILPTTDRGQSRPKDTLATKISSIEIESGTSRFDLTFTCSKSGSRSASSLRVGINYNTDLFRDATIERMATHFSTLAESILTDAGTAIHKLDILSPSEKRLLIETFNDTQSPYPSDKTIVDIFEEQAAKRPDHIAIVLEDSELSYRELHERAHGLARVLVEKYQIKPQEIVGLMVDRNEWSIIGLMGILMAGGAYLPVDPFYPGTRIDYMLTDSGCRVLLTENKYVESNGRIPSSVMNVDIETLVSSCDRIADTRACVDKPLSHPPSPDSLAYIIYTSGSTGLPKGVMIEHCGFVNMSLHQIRAFGVSDSDRVLQFASASFDAALSEIFMALLAGAAVVVVRKETMDDPLLFVQYLEEKRVTCMTLPPVYLNALDKEKLNTVTTIITAGEAPNTGDAVFFSRRKHYFNAYGPTEISVCATIERVSPDGDYRRNIPIGRPISNMSIDILDDLLQLVPMSIPGEICISGAGLARGYLNRAGLTAEKFVAHPFRVGERLYRTGDIGRWLPDGTIEWLGRNDDQVKIRGYRIELGEIKNALLRHASVQDAIVIAEGRDPEELAAYFTARERLEPADLRSHIGSLLPNYMIPRYLIQLNDLPMTAHGKVNRRLLPDPRASSKSDQTLLCRLSGDALAKPRNDLEKWMLALWQEVLGKRDISIHDNFFNSGGNSLRSLQLISRISTGL